MSQDFTGTTLPTGWHAYSGQPGSDTGGWWDPSHVTVGQGMLVLHTNLDPVNYGQGSGQPWVEGGVSCWPQCVGTYGEWLVRSRVTSAVGVTQVEILWPYSGSWPPEIDFNESNGTNESTAGEWYQGASGPTLIQSSTLSPTTGPLYIDLTQWHTWGVIVTPTTITETVDGVTWATMPNNDQTPKELTLQQQVWPCDSQYELCPSSATPSEVDMDVDWVVVYSPNS